MNIQDLHIKAISIADEAFIKKFNGKLDEAKLLFREAFRFEKEVAIAAQKENISEPSISVLLKSAASLAINADEFREAEKLISVALCGEPPFEIAEELRNLLEELYFQRHLQLQGITLNPNNNKRIDLAGRLSAADEDKSNIRLTLDNGVKYSVTVPEGLGDIVKKYWGEQVKITGTEIRKGAVKLIDIDPA